MSRLENLSASECAVVSSLCQGGIPTVSEVAGFGLRAEHFVNADMAAMYGIILAHTEKTKKRIDRSILALKLHEAWKAEGDSRSMDDARILIADTWQQSYTTEGALFHAERVRESAVHRAVWRTLEGMAGNAVEFDTGTDLLTAVQKQLNDIANNNTTFHRPTELREIVPAWWDEFKTNYTGDGPVWGTLDTGVDALTRAVKGFRPKTLSIIAARTGEGKTALAGHIAFYSAKKGRAGRIYSLEMDQNELLERFTWLDSGIDPARYEDKQLSKEEWKTLSATAGTLSRLPLSIVDPARMTISEICRDARKAKYQGALDFIVVDYLQLIKADEAFRGQSRLHLLSDISHELKGLSRELEIPVIALAQLNRDVVKENREPSKHDIRECGDIENDADAILLLFPDPQSLKTDDGAKKKTEEYKPSEYVVKIDKMRKGAAPVRVPVLFDKRVMSFEENKNDCPF